MKTILKRLCKIDHLLVTNQLLFCVVVGKKVENRGAGGARFSKEGEALFGNFPDCAICPYIGDFEDFQRGGGALR